MYRVLWHMLQKSLCGSHLSSPRPGNLIPNTCTHTFSPGLLPAPSLVWVSTKAGTEYGAHGCGTRTTARHIGSVCLETCQCLQRGGYPLPRPSPISNHITSWPRLQTLQPSPLAGRKLTPDVNGTCQSCKPRRWQCCTSVRE